MTKKKVILSEGDSRRFAFLKDFPHMAVQRLD